jgi:hypothetical protein
MTIGFPAPSQSEKKRGLFSFGFLLPSLVLPACLAGEAVGEPVSRPVSGADRFDEAFFVS